MTTKGTRLGKPRLAHIAGVDHPAHQIEGFIVAKSLDNGTSDNKQEGLKMDLTQISKSLETPLTKENAPEIVSALKDGVAFLISKAVAEDEKAKEKAAPYEAKDTNVEHVDTDVTKASTAETDAEHGEPDGDELTMEAKAKAYDDLMASKKKASKSGDVLEMSKALGTNAVDSDAFSAMQKELNSMKAEKLFASTEAEVRKAAGAYQTDIAPFVKAIISVGGVETEDGKAIIKSLKATAEQISIGGDFRKEIGANGAEIAGDLKSANAQLKNIAKTLVADEGLSMVNALSEAAKRNPELTNLLTGGAN